MRAKNSEARVKILVADDDSSLRERIREETGEHGYSVVASEAGENGVEACRHDIYDVIVADARFGPDESGLAALHAYKSVQPESEIIITAAESRAGQERDLWRAGVFHRLAKPFAVEDLLVHIERALGYRELKNENRILRRQALEHSQFSQLVGRTPAMLAIRNRLAICAESHSPVLVRGEPGTGKDLVARLIHYGGPRKDQRFVKVDCTLSAPVLDAELFGWVEGEAVSGLGNRSGLLAEASGGTVFLDEVSALPAGLESKLLRTLKTRRVRPPGSGYLIPVDIRFISADRGGLGDQIRRGRFAEDLAERLAAFEIELPPLRERSADIPVLTEHFLDLLTAGGPKRCQVSPQAMMMLLGYAWPDNVRGLENALARAADHNRTGLLAAEDFPLEVQAGFFPAREFNGLSAGLPSLQDLGRRYLAKVLRFVHGNKSAAAAILGISRKTLYRMERPPSTKRRSPKKRDG